MTVSLRDMETEIQDSYERIVLKIDALKAENERLKLENERLKRLADSLRAEGESYLLVLRKANGAEIVLWPHLRLM